MNMLLAELAPMDVRQMFIIHKELFYAHYATWSDRKQQLCGGFSGAGVSGGQGKARATALFGPEPGMDELHRPQMADGAEARAQHGRSGRPLGRGAEGRR